MKKKHLWNDLIIGFVNGIGILLPVFITVIIVKFLVNKLNEAILTPLLKVISFVVVGDVMQHVAIAKFIIFLMVIIGIAFIGLAAKIIIVRKAFALGELILLKVPIFGKIYKAVKEISSAFFGADKTAFSKVVLVEFPHKGKYSIGFTTSTIRGEIKEKVGEGFVTIMVPTLPNPTTGFFLVCRKEEVIFLDMPVEDGLKIVLSVGSVIPDGKAIGSGDFGVGGA